MYEVIYFSRGGNTQKVAAAIAGEVGVKPLHVRWMKSLPEGTDIFLGSGLYFMRPARMVRNFIRNHDLRGKKIAIFGTSTSGFGIETLWMEWLLKRKGAIITGKYYCAGKFGLRVARGGLSLRGHSPTDRDIERARQFARSIRDAFQVAPSGLEAGPLVAGASTQARN